MPDHASWVPRFLGWVVRLLAVLAALGVALPKGRRDYTSPTLDVASEALGVLVATIAAGAVLLLAGGITRRKRRAWLVLAAVVVIGLAGNARDHAWLVAAADLLVLGLLIWGRRAFVPSCERASRWVAWRVFAVMSGVSIAVGLVLTRHTDPAASVPRRFVDVLSGLCGFAPHLGYLGLQARSLTQMTLAGLGALTAFLTLLALLAPVRKQTCTVEADEDRLRDLLTRHGARDSLGYFALRSDKVAVFSPSGKAAVVHRVLGEVSLASGDPLGDPEAWPQAIALWLAEADARGWVPGVVGAGEAAAEAYSRAGLDAFELGDEAVLDLDAFSLDGRSMRGVRSAVNRVGRAGYTVRLDRQSTLGSDELAEVISAVESIPCEAARRAFAMGLGRIGDPRDPAVMVARCRAQDGRLVAVLSFVPWGGDGLALDILRQAPDAEHGTVEFVICQVAALAGAQGVRRISLNFAVFRSSFERGARVGAGPILRAWRRLLVLTSRWWKIESLYRANAQYQPAWVPRFVCFRHVSDLPRIAVAALEADAVIARPRLRWLGR